MATDVKNDASLSTGLVHYWELEETSGTRVDSHGSNDLADNGTVTSTTGIQGTAALFTAANTEYLNSANSAAPSGDFSFSLWLHQNSRSANQQVFNDYTGGEGGMVFRVNSDGKLFLQFSDNTTNASKNTTSASQISTGSTYHIVVTVDESAGKSGVVIYVNGSSVALTPGGGTAATSYISQGTTEVGGLVGGVQAFDGWIDEIGVWSKILSSTEVTALYNSGSGIPYDAGGVTTTYNALAFCSF